MALEASRTASTFCVVCSTARATRKTCSHADLLESKQTTAITVEEISRNSISDRSITNTISSNNYHKYHFGSNHHWYHHPQHLLSVRTQRRHQQYRHRCANTYTSLQIQKSKNSMFSKGWRRRRQVWTFGFPREIKNPKIKQPKNTKIHKSQKSINQKIHKSKNQYQKIHQKSKLASVISTILGFG